MRVFHYQDGRLLPARDPLECVRDACSICINTADTVFVGDRDTESVYLVNLSTDTVIRRLERPSQVTGYPSQMSVLGRRLLVCYGVTSTLVTYCSHSLTPSQVLNERSDLNVVTSITTDIHSSSFLVTDRRSVFVLDEKHKLLRHRVYKACKVDGELRDCAMVQSQLWVAHWSGHIAVLTSQ